MPNLTTQQTIKVRVNQLDGSLVPQNKMPVVLKNTAQESIGIGGLGNVNEGTPSEGGTLVFNTVTQQYDVRQLTVTDLGDVVGTPSDGDLLIFDGSTNTFFYGTRSQTLAGLSDVDSTARNDGDVITYDASSNSYIHRTVLTSGSSVNTSQLTVGNVTITSISDFANTTQLGSLSTGSNTELVTARAIREYVDNIIAASGQNGGGAATLNGLLDVFINGQGLINRQVLVYDGARNEWVNRRIIGDDNIAVGSNDGGDITLSLAANINLSTLTANTITTGVLATSNLQVTGNTTIEGTLGVGQRLSVAREATFANTITITGGASVGGALAVNGALTVANTLTIQSSALVGQQLDANVVNIAGPLTTSGNITFGNASSVMVFDAKVGSSILPDANNVYSLGSPTARFKDLYISAGTLFLGDAVLSAADGTFRVSTDTIFDGNTIYQSDVSIESNLTVDGDAVFSSNVALGSNTSDVIQVRGLIDGNIIPTTNNGITVGNTSNRVSTVFANTIAAVSGNFSGDVVVSGNLVVQGDSTRIDVSSMVVEDPLLELSSNNTSDVVDIGFYGGYNDGTVGRYAGLFRDASDTGKFVLFANLHITAAPNLTVNRSSPSFSISTLVAYIESGGLVSSPSTVSITATGSRAVSIAANNITISTPLNISSGGVGRSVLTENAVVVGNGNSPVKLVTASQQSQVLSVVGGVPTFVSSLDAGEY